VKHLPVRTEKSLDLALTPRYDFGLKNGESQQTLTLVLPLEEGIVIFDLEKVRIGVIGLGYVGLPLAVEFGKKFSTIGYDINQERVDELRSGRDSSLEVEPDELQSVAHLSYTTDANDLKACNVYIVTVPTPVDQHKQPDLRPLVKASETLGKIIKPGDVAIYESTVYPGATEEDCIPVIESVSGLTFNQDFFAGYSPERINPGDKEHRLVNIKKVTSGSTPEVADFIDKLYNTILINGTHKASSIKVAEASKVIENTQRDVNIALINELAQIFNRLGIDTTEVLEAAGSKWNFLPFRPGLVGGHCIGVDPYYLSHKAQATGYQPEIILACRRLSDSMGAYVVYTVMKLMLKRGVVSGNSKVLVMGLTFKENCPDLRNTRVVDIVAELEDYGASVDVYDPWVDAREAEHEYNITPIQSLRENHYDAIILAVAHSEFIDMGTDKIRSLCKPEGILYDVKNILPKEAVDGRL
jgi:UDP-N-acetyl-D-galactosamine dehydrogenase